MVQHNKESKVSSFGRSHTVRNAIAKEPILHDSVSYFLLEQRDYQSAKVADLLVSRPVGGDVFVRLYFEGIAENVTLPSEGWKLSKSHSLTGKRAILLFTSSLGVYFQNFCPDQCSDRALERWNRRLTPLLGGIIPAPIVNPLLINSLPRINPQRLPHLVRTFGVFALDIDFDPAASMAMPSKEIDGDFMSCLSRTSVFDCICHDLRGVGARCTFCDAPLKIPEQDNSIELSFQNQSGQRFYSAVCVPYTICPTLNFRAVSYFFSFI